MRKTIFLLILFSFLQFPALQAQSQNSIIDETTVTVFEPSSLSQFAKDLRRWEIISFGIFPFVMFNVVFITDMIRWNNENGFDFSEQGRRYAPWPLKSAGGIDMTSEELRRSILISAGISMLAATIDLMVTLIKRNSERRRVQRMQSGSVTIERIPPEEEQPDVELPQENAEK